MKEHPEEEALRAILQEALAPVDPELRRDLWPDMLRTLDARTPVTPWYDWVLLSVVVGALMFFPGLILLFAYHI